MSLPGSVIVEAGPFNGPDDPDASMQWVDITSYVNDSRQIPNSTFGRQGDFSLVIPGQFSITLNNQDHRFTPGNPSSPYYPGWRTAMRLRMRETVGYRTFTLADGNLLQPELTIQTPGFDQVVTVTAVDRIGRLQQGRKLISMLTEWIKYNAPTSLVYHWPLVEPAGAKQGNEIHGSSVPMLIEGAYIGAAVISGTGVFTFGGTAGPTGDDASYPTFTPVLASTSDSVVLGNRLACRNLGITVTGAFITLVAWVRLDATNTGTYQILFMRDNGSVNVVQLTKTTVVRDVFQLSVTIGAGNVTINLPAIRYGQWQLLSIRLTTATGAVDMWVDGLAVSGTTSTAISGTFDVLIAEGDSPSASVGQLQLYQGAFTQTQHLAQFAAGRTGLSGQYTGDRIVTVMRYAGIAAGELGAIDQGTSMMSQASIAGRTPLDVARDAETTEQGLLHAYGRQLVFHSRTRRYNR